MVVADQNVPLRPFDPKIARDAFSAILDSRFADRPAIRIGAGVNRVGEDVKDRVVDRRFPLQTSAVRSMVDGGQRDPFLPEPKMDLPHALQFDELAEDQGKRLAHTKVRIPFDLIGSAAHIANRDRREQFAASGLLFERQCQSNGGSPTCSATAVSQAAIYAARVRHSANAAKRLCL